MPTRWKVTRVRKPKRFMPSVVFLLWLTIQAWKWMRSADCLGCSRPDLRKLLADLQAARDRSARFRTVIALADATGTRFFEGVCRGTIIDEERGSKGFGYDRIFVPEGGNRTFAELDAEEKNAISHRGAALRRLAAYLHDQAG